MRDDELDAVLSSLAFVEPEPGLADRVVRAIEAPDAPRRAIRWPVPVGLSAAAMALMALGLTWRAAQPVAMPSVADAPPLAVSAADLPRDLPADDAVPVGTVAYRRPRPALGDDPWPYRLPALERSAPLAIDRLEHEAIREPNLGVAPLSIAQLEIESLER